MSTPSHLRQLIEQHQQLTKDMLQQHQLLTKQLADQRNESNQLAVTTAVEAMNERLFKLNELRGQLQDVINTLETKVHSEAVLTSTQSQFKGVIKEVEELKQWRSKSEGRNQVIQILWPLIIGIIVFMLNKYFK